MWKSAITLIARSYWAASILFLIPLTVSSGVVNISNATQAAINWYSLETTASNVVSNASPIYYNGHLSRYVINFTNGFVMTSACDAMNPILGFSTEHNFNTINMSPELVGWLSIYDLTIDSLITNNSINAFYSTRWNNLLALQSSGTRLTGGTNTPPLIQTTWSQGYPYNNSVSQSTATCGTCPTGCVATAMGQIMKYWNSPNGLNPTPNFDWCNMPEYLDAGSPLLHINAVANLLASIGSGISMQYCQSNACESGAFVSPEGLNLFQLWGYNANYNARWTSAASNLLHGETWYYLLRNEIDNNRPVLYAGYNDVAGEGHCWVLDGDDNNDPQNFHMNFGWGGLDDAYYYLDNINPSPVPNGTYNDSQEAITGISPANHVIDCSANINLNSLAALGHVSYSPDGSTATFYAGTLYNIGPFDLSVTPVPGPDYLVLEACNEIDLNPGFGFTSRAQAGFTAEITNCQPISGNRMMASNRNKTSILDNNYSVKGSSQFIDTIQGINFNLHPNPATTIIMIETQNIKTFNVQLTNMLGQTVYRTQQPASNNVAIDLLSMPSGVYIVQIQDIATGGIGRKRVVKE